jgi:hypothetical protein
MSRNLERRLRTNGAAVVHWLMFTMGCGTIAWISLFRTIGG